MGVAKPNSFRLFKYLTKAPIVILAMQKATINHVGDDFFDIIAIFKILSEFLSKWWTEVFLYFQKFELIEFRKKFLKKFWKQI